MQVTSGTVVGVVGGEERRRGDVGKYKCLLCLSCCLGLLAAGRATAGPHRAGAGQTDSDRSLSLTAMS